MQLVDYSLAGKSRRISAGKYRLAVCIPLQLHFYFNTFMPFPPFLTNSDLFCVKTVN
jgi:hypothetical protein